MEVLADVVMLPGESFVRAIVLTWKTNFGNTKVAFDASMTIIAGILSLFFFHRLQGVREGTGPSPLAVSMAAADMKLDKNWLKNWDISFMTGKLLK